MSGSVESFRMKSLIIICDNQVQTSLIITINDTSNGDLPLIITISDTCKNHPKSLDSDNTINLSSLIVSLVEHLKIKTRLIYERLCDLETIGTPSNILCNVQCCNLVGKKKDRV
jgi:hypothetical protein